jgi:hypothetical protein
VSKTRIFVMPSLDLYDAPPRQLTVYSNTVQTPAENLMILPVPWPDTVEFQETFMKSYPKFLDDCEASLYRQPQYLSAAHLQRSWATTRTTAPMLPVFDIGSYRVSVVPSVHEFARLNGAVFSLPTELKGILTNEYGNQSVPIGFICCKLRAGQQTYEPLAYTHRRWKLNSLFVPTRHYHAEVTERDVYGYTYFGEALTVSGQRALEEKPHWDHAVYSLDTEPRCAHHSDSIPKHTNSIRADLLPKGFRTTPAAPVHCWEKTGAWENIDLEFPLAFLEPAARRAARNHMT